MMFIVAMAMVIALLGGPNRAGASPSPQPAGSDSQADAYACEPGTVARAAKAIGFAGTDFWTDGWRNACRIDPAHDDRAIVALTYVAGEEKTGKEHSGQDYNALDLDLVVLDLESDKVLAHTHESESVEDGGDRFENIVIDTARYVLAPGARAFGVSVSNATHCYCANGGYTTLTLYLVRGDKLDKVGGVQTSSSQSGTERGDTPPPCTNLSSNETTTVSIGKGNSHGLADLLLTTVVTKTYDDDDPSKCPALKPTKTTNTLRFDGTTYK
jgi:hypothetical protein